MTRSHPPAPQRRILLFVCKLFRYVRVFSQLYQVHRPRLHQIARTNSNFFRHLHNYAQKPSRRRRRESALKRYSIRLRPSNGKHGEEEGKVSRQQHRNCQTSRHWLVRKCPKVCNPRRTTKRGAREPRFSHNQEATRPRLLLPYRLPDHILDLQASRPILDLPVEEDCWTTMPNDLPSRELLVFLRMLLWKIRTKKWYLDWSWLE